MSFQIAAGVDLKNMKQVLGLYFLQHVPEDKMMNVFLVSGLRLKTFEIQRQGDPDSLFKRPFGGVLVTRRRGVQMNLV